MVKLIVYTTAKLMLVQSTEHSELSTVMMALAFSFGQYTFFSKSVFSVEKPLLMQQQFVSSCLLTVYTSACNCTAFSRTIKTYLVFSFLMPDALNVTFRWYLHFALGFAGSCSFL